MWFRKSRRNLPSSVSFLRTCRVVNNDVIVKTKFIMHIHNADLHNSLLLIWARMIFLWVDVGLIHRLRLNDCTALNLNEGVRCRLLWLSHFPINIPSIWSLSLSTLDLGESLTFSFLWTKIIKVWEVLINSLILYWVDNLLLLLLVRLTSPRWFKDFLKSLSFNLMLILRATSSSKD